MGKLIKVLNTRSDNKYFHENESLKVYDSMVKSIVDTLIQKSELTKKSYEVQAELPEMMESYGQTDKILVSDQKSQTVSRPQNSLVFTP